MTTGQLVMTSDDRPLPPKKTIRDKSMFFVQRANGFSCLGILFLGAGNRFSLLASLDSNAGTPIPYRYPPRRWAGFLAGFGFMCSLLTVSFGFVLFYMK